MHSELFDYADGDTVCEGFVAFDNAKTGKRPCVLVAHQWAGQSDHERETAAAFARRGYVGIAIDVYGKGVRGGLMDDNSALMGPWMAERAMLRRRLLAAVDAAAAHPAVDPDRIAVIGYCFGGLCALDLARSADPRVKGVVSIHGIFPPPNVGPQADMTASVLILHGYDDPMAPPQDVLAIAKELTDAKADWQLHAYGHAMHAFTAVGVHAPERGIAYNELADRRSRVAVQSFLDELFD